MNHAHAAAAAAAGSLDDDGITDIARDVHDLFRIVRQSSIRTRHAWHARLLHRVLGADLVAHEAYGFGTRADENETALFHTFGKIGVFRKETVARMDGFGIGDFGRADDGRNIQIALTGWRGSDADGFVGQFDIFGIAVGFGVYGHGFDTEFAAGTLNTQRYFTAIRN